MAGLRRSERDAEYSRGGTNYGPDARSWIPYHQFRSRLFVLRTSAHGGSVMQNKSLPAFRRPHGGRGSASLVRGVEGCILPGGPANRRGTSVCGGDGAGPAQVRGHLYTKVLDTVPVRRGFRHVRSGMCRTGPGRAWHHVTRPADARWGVRGVRSSCVRQVFRS